jgi:hypothetical protein
VSSAPCIRYHSPQIESLIQQINVLRLETMGGPAGNSVQRLPELEKLLDALKELTALHEQFARYDLTVQTESKETIKLNLGLVYEESKTFYQEHNLSVLLERLPRFEQIELTPEQLKRIHEAMKEGFDRAIFFPSAETLSASFDNLIIQTAAKPLDKMKFPNIADNDNYPVPPNINDTWKDPSKRQSFNRPKGQPYLLLYSSKPIPNETTIETKKEPLKNRTFPDLILIFEQKQWQGLMIEEHLILQRKETEARQNRSFDAYDDDAAKSEWSWLLDTREVDPTGAARAVPYVDWNSEECRVNVFSPGSSYTNLYLGARPAVVVPISNF